MNEAAESITEEEPDDDFADYVISLCFRSDRLSAEKFAEVLKLRPTTARAKGIPWHRGGGGQFHHIYFQCAGGFARAIYALDEFEAQLCKMLRPFAERLDVLAKIRSRCQRIIIHCSVRTSRRAILAPFSSETLQLLATVGFELRLNVSTRAPKKKRLEASDQTEEPGATAPAENEGKEDEREAETG